MFITTFTSGSRLSVSRTRFMQSVPPHPTSWRSILLLSSHLCQDLPSGFIRSGLPTKRLYTYLLSPIHVTCTSHQILDLYLLRCTDHESYSKIYINILPIVIKCVCDIIQVFCYGIQFLNLSDVFFKTFSSLWCFLKLFLLFGVSLLWAHPSICKKIVCIMLF